MLFHHGFPSRTGDIDTTTEAPPATAAPVSNPDALLVRALGTRQLTAGIFNYTVGSGIFALPALVVAQIGTAAPVAYLLCAVLIGLVVLVFAEAGSRVSATGGPYAYVEIGLGPFVGFLAGVLLLLTDVSAAGAVAALLAGTVARLIGAEGAAATGLLAVLLIVIVAALNIRGLRLGAAVIEISSVAKLLPLVLFVAVGAFFVSPANLRIDSLPPVRTISATAGVLIFAFAGIEAALMPSGEVKDPHRTVPRAAITALALVTVLYLAVQAVATGIMGPALATDRVAPLATAAGSVAGRAGRVLLLAGAAVSTFGWMTGSLLAGPRGVFALGRDGFIPRRFAAVHERFRTPHVAILTYAVLVAVLAVSGTFEALAVLSNIAALTLYFLCAVAAWALRRRDVRAGGEPFRVPGGPLLTVVTCALLVWVISQTISATELRATAGVLLLAAGVYALRASRLRALARRSP